MSANVQAKKTSATLLLGLIGTVATAGAAVYAIHNQMKRKNKRDHQFAHQLAKLQDARSTLDNIFNDSIATVKEKPVLKCALGQRYKDMPT